MTNKPTNAHKLIKEEIEELRKEIHMGPETWEESVERSMLKIAQVTANEMAVRGNEDNPITEKIEELKDGSQMVRILPESQLVKDQQAKYEKWFKK